MYTLLVRIFSFTSGYVLLPIASIVVGLVFFTSMTISDFIPPVYLAVIWGFFISARFENLLWIRSERFASAVIELFVTMTGAMALIFSIGFYVGYAWFISFAEVVGLFVSAKIFCMIWMAATAVIPDRDQPFLWLACTFAIWPLAIILIWIFF